MIIRPCTDLDAALLDSWEPPQGDYDHLHWLMSQLKNPLTKVYIGVEENRGRAVCFGRITEQHDHCDIGWFTAPKFRRKGFGLQLAFLLRETATKPLKATIHSENLASEAIAYRLGMTPDDLNGYILPCLREWRETTSVC